MQNNNDIIHNMVTDIIDNIIIKEQNNSVTILIDDFSFTSNNDISYNNNNNDYYYSDSELLRKFKNKSKMKKRRSFDFDKIKTLNKYDTEMGLITKNEERNSRESNHRMSNCFEKIEQIEEFVIDGIKVIKNEIVDGVIETKESIIMFYKKKIYEKLLYFIYTFPYYTFSMTLIYILLFNLIVPKSNTYEKLIYNSNENLNIYTWYSYSLLSLDKIHLFINLLSFILYGITIEVENNFLRILVIHTLSIFGGIMGFAWMTRDINNKILIGEGSGYYGLIAGSSVNLIINFKESNRLQRLFHVIMTPLSLLLDMFLYIFRYEKDAGYSSHFAGFVIGGLSSILFLKNKNYPNKKIIKIITSLCLSVMFILGFLNLALNN